MPPKRQWKFMIYSLRELIDQRSNAETRVLRRTTANTHRGRRLPSRGKRCSPRGTKAGEARTCGHLVMAPCRPVSLLPYTLKKYPRYGSDRLSCARRYHHLVAERLDGVFADAAGSAVWSSGDAYRSSTLIIDTVPDFIAVKVVDSSGKSKRFRQSGFGAVFDAKTVLGSDDAIIPLVQAAEYSREIVRYDPEPKNGEPYSLEKIEFIPFVERHALEHGKKGQKM